MIVLSLMIGHHFEKGNMPRILILGCGGRESVLISLLSPQHTVTQWSDQSAIPMPRLADYDLVIPAAETYLERGVADQCAESKTPCFGPTRHAAQLETSKAFAKRFMQQHNIATARFEVISNWDDYLKVVIPYPRVLKRDGLASGKGVFMVDNEEDAKQILPGLLDHGDVVVEQQLKGPELSAMYFCDGSTVAPMPLAKDYKRLCPNGPMTGGMGCVSMPRTQLRVASVAGKINEFALRTVRHMPFCGVLYLGIMVVGDVPYVLEYNMRFGDPEAQCVLPLLRTDLYQLMMSCCQRRLDHGSIRWEYVCSGVVTLVHPNYPAGNTKEPLDEPVALPDRRNHPKIRSFLGSTLDGGRTGGRILHLQSQDVNMSTALRRVYTYLESIPCHHYYRRDIGSDVMRLRIAVLGSTNGSNLMPLDHYMSDRNMNASILVVISDRKDAGILNRASQTGMIRYFIDPSGKTRVAYDREVTENLQRHHIELVLMIGYMRIVSTEFVNHWRGRCYNVHPSLLPKFSGGMDRNVHQAVLDAKETESGCTVHEVTEVLDGGAIVAQRQCRVDPTDTVDSLKGKVQSLEVEALAEAVYQFNHDMRFPGLPKGKRAIHV